MGPKKLPNFSNTKIKKVRIINAFLKNPHDWNYHKSACDDRGTQLIFDSLGMQLHPDKRIEIRKLVVILRSDFQRRLKKCSGHKQAFFKNNSSWVNTYFRLPSEFLLNPGTTAILKHPTLPRKTKPFEKLATRSKRRKLSALSKHQMNQSEREIILTASKTLAERSGAKTGISALLQSIASPTKVSSVVDKLKQPTIQPLSAEEALNFFLEKRMTHNLYSSLKAQGKARGADIYPSHRMLSKAREECRPNKDEMIIQEFSAVVSTESLLHCTAKRIIKLQENVIESVLENRKGSLKLVLICSWGCDGSSSYSIYKQKSSLNTTNVDEGNLFSTTMTPLRLIALVGKHNREIVVWNNILPQSYRSCRPLKIQYKKESKALILEEISRVKGEIKQTSELDLILSNGRKLNVSFQMELTVIDGKVLAAIQNTPCQCCPICHSKPNDFNIKENVGTSKFQPKPSTLSHGASCLHARIRFMECLLHLGYRMQVKVWRVSSRKDKEKVSARKKEIQNSFKTQLNLRIDFPNSNGAGSSNDGNTARRFFENYKISAKLLGIEEELVLRFSHILTAINCQLPLNPSVFGKYCVDTNNLFTDLYNWFKLPASVHKILIHSEDIILSSILPLGMLSEEGAESRHKYYRHDKLHHARKNSRLNTMRDVFLRALETSDPLIAAYSARTRKNLGNRKPLPLEVVSFLIEPSISAETPESSQETSSTQTSTSELSLYETETGDLETLVDDIGDRIELESESCD